MRRGTAKNRNIAPKTAAKTTAYTSQEVREAMTGHPNASRDQLAYAVMVSLGLIGQAKTTHEWEALAVGQYHLTRGAAAATPEA